MVGEDYLGRLVDTFTGISQRRRPVGERKLMGVNLRRFGTCALHHIVRAGSAREGLDDYNGILVVVRNGEVGRRFNTGRLIHGAFAVAPKRIGNHRLNKLNARQAGVILLQSNTRCRKTFMCGLYLLAGRC
jgi:hypothetical protein